MPPEQTPEQLAERVVAGKTPAIARAISWAESADPRFPDLLRLIFSRTGKARVIGLTGAPGAGKSTMTGALARLARAEGKTVGIVAVDPSSPFSGGAILGDRIRMQELYTDPGVLIRSMATRGNLGGLARATADAVDVLDAAGFDEVLVETVGVGQDEVEIIRLAESSVVVLTPGMGDDIQAIKAGLMEVADVFVVNKSDREGADRVVTEVLQMLELGEHGAWVPPVLKSVARLGTGVPELRTELERHRQFLLGPEGRERRRSRVRRRIESIVRERLFSELRALSGTDGSLEAHTAAVEERSEDPMAAAEALLSALRAGGRKE
jgi:LAO/AO transport system kinase